MKWTIKRTTWDSFRGTKERRWVISCHSQRNLLEELIYKTEFFCRSMRTRQQLELMRTTQSNWKRFCFCFSLSVKVCFYFPGSLSFSKYMHHAPSKYNLCPSVRQLPQVVQFHPRQAEAQWRSQRSQRKETAVIWSWWVSTLVRFTKICDNVNYIVRAPPWKVCAESALKLNLHNNLLPFLTCVTRDNIDQASWKDWVGKIHTNTLK